MDIHSYNDDNFIFFGIFNADVSDKSMLGYGESYKLNNLLRHPICFKNPKTRLVLTYFWQIGIEGLGILISYKLGYQIFIRWQFLLWKCIRESFQQNYLTKKISEIFQWKFLKLSQRCFFKQKPKWRKRRNRILS